MMRNKHGRIRCYLRDVDCKTWADRWTWMSTAVSVMERVAVCNACLPE